MLQKLAQKLHWLILVYTGWCLYGYYEVMNLKIAENESAISELNQKIAKARTDAKRIEQYMKNVETARDKIEKTAQEVEKLQQQFPSSIDEIEINEYLADLALKMNIKNVTVKAENEENKGFYFAKRFSFHGLGTYLQFLVLLERIEDNPRILNIVSSKFQKGKAVQKSRFQLVDGEITIETYRHNPQYKEER